MKSKHQNIIFPVGFGLSGEVSIVARNVITGAIVDERPVKKNTLLAGYINTLFSSDFPILAGCSSVNTLQNTAVWMNKCAIGTDGTAATINDTGIKGTTLSTVTGTDVSFTPYGSYPISLTRKFAFPAGSANGTINEVVIMTSSGTALSRQVVSPSITINDVTRVEVTWTYTLQRNANSWTGTITGGQRDGTTNINWVATINNRQLWRWAFGYPVMLNVYGDTGCYGVYPWRGSRVVTIGNSNAASDLTNDSEDTIKGSTVYAKNIPSLSSVSTYTNNSFYRDIILGAESTEANGSWGEIVPAISTYAYGNNQFSPGNMRITFNPPLDKPAPDDTTGWRTYVTIRTSITPN